MTEPIKRKDVYSQDEADVIIAKSLVRVYEKELARLYASIDTGRCITDTEFNESFVESSNGKWDQVKYIKP